METKSGEKRDEAKVGEFSCLLEAVHRLVYAKDNVWLPRQGITPVSNPVIPVVIPKTSCFCQEAVNFFWLI